MPATLSHWDELETTKSSGEGPGDLVLSFFAKERPLLGAAGLVDWRLYGQLSRLIISGHCSGCSGESLMMPAGPRLPFERIFLFGLGQGERMSDSEYAGYARKIRATLRRAGSSRYAVQPPGRATGLIAAKRAAQLWLDLGDSEEEHVTLLDSAGAHKEMGDLLMEQGVKGAM
ncbi:MAG: hypothetical protein GY811_27880 [Myxococcales bacterium]|nr:hypothetical protein [Myxococcales bacterium]